MIFRKKYLDLKTIQHKKQLSNSLTVKLTKSFQYNFFLEYKKRLSFFLQKDLKNKHLNFYNSQNKLRCGITFSKRVAFKNLNFSRFYLVRHANSLVLSPFQK